MTYRTPLAVAYDTICDIWMVREASHAFSFSKVPHKRIDSRGNEAPVTYEFETKREALEQLRRLNLWLDRGNELEFRHAFTDGLFETVADTKYGAAWN